MLGGLLVGICGCLSAQILWQAFGEKIYHAAQQIYRLCFASNAVTISAAPDQKRCQARNATAKVKITVP